MTTSHERVLCFPRSLLDELGVFQGFRTDDGSILEKILHSGQARFIERFHAEEDPGYKQLIPYIVITHGDKILCYTRGKQTGEARLAELRSVGVGGHITVTDRDFFQMDLSEVFWSGLRREVTEEVHVKSTYTERFAGFINDDSNPVGSVHLGVVLVRELAQPSVKKKERSVTALEFQTIEELRSRKPSLETWSRIIVDNWTEITGCSVRD